MVYSEIFLGKKLPTVSVAVWKTVVKFVSKFIQRCHVRDDFILSANCSLFLKFGDGVLVGESMVVAQQIQYL